jgi:hypothetical protein
MAEKTAAPKGSVRWGRILTSMIILAIAGAALYGASWLNSRRYYLIVGATEVRVAKGRMLPVGHEAFIAREPDLRRAYEPFPLPGGINVPRGETTFIDRVELDQALFRLLKDCIGYTLSKDDRSAPESIEKYLLQIRAIPGTSVSQQIELQTLERDAAFVGARHKMSEGLTSLKDAVRMFRESAKGASGRNSDAETRAAIIEAAIARIESEAGLSGANGATQPNENPAIDAAPTTTTATRAPQR